MKLKLATTVLLLCCCHGLIQASSSSACDNYPYFKNETRCLENCDDMYDCHSCQRVFGLDPCLWECQIVYCGNLSIPLQGTLSTSENTCGSHVHYNCNPGFKLIGSASRDCHGNGSWDGVEPICVAECAPLCPPRDGNMNITYSLDGLLAGAQVFYNCFDDFQLIGSAVRTCTEHGNWTGEEPACEPVGCSPLSEPLNGDVDITGGLLGILGGYLYTVGSYALYECDRGYELSNETARECMPIGSSYDWSGTASTCDPVSCGPLNDPTNGTVSYANDTFESEATYSCDLGFVLFGDIRVTCTSCSVWNAPPPVCVPIDCGILCNPLNGFVNITETTLGSTALYGCEDGYQLNGTNTTVCLPSGLWSGVMPFCQTVQVEIESITCEHSSATLSCTGGTTLHIQYANYGRTVGAEICPHDSINDLNCMAANSLSVVTTACEGETTCTVAASNSVFGDPCVSTYKYLEIHYSCE